MILKWPPNKENSKAYCQMRDSLSMTLIHSLGVEAGLGYRYISDDIPQHIASSEVKFEGVFCKDVSFYFKDCFKKPTDFNKVYYSISSSGSTGQLFMNSYYFFEDIDCFDMEVYSNDYHNPLAYFHYRTDKKSFLEEKFFSYCLLATDQKRNLKSKERDVDIYSREYPNYIRSSVEYTDFFYILIKDTIYSKNSGEEEKSLLTDCYINEDFKDVIKAISNQQKTYYTIRLYDKDRTKFLEMYMYFPDYFNDMASVFMKLMR